MKFRQLDRRQFDQKELSQRLKSIFDYFDSHRKQYEDEALEWYKLFKGYMKDDVPEGKSNLHIPKCYEILDTIRSRILMTFFNQRPYMEFTPMPTRGKSIESIMQNKQKSDIAAAFVDEQLEKVGVRTKFYDFLTNMLIFPAAFLGVGWRFEEKEIQKRAKIPVLDDYGSFTGRWELGTVNTVEVVYDDNEIFNIDFFDFWGDPDADSIDDCRGVFHREWLTIEALVDKLELLARVGDGMVYPIDLQTILEGRKEEQGRRKKQSAVGISTGGSDPYKGANSEEMETKQEVELLHYWEDDRHCIMVNRNDVLYDGPNPYWRHGKKPFIRGVYDRLPGEFYGMSGMQIIHKIQEEINTTHNQRMDNVNMLINVMWKKLRGSSVRDEDLVSRPNGVVEVDTMEDIQPIQMPEIPQSVWRSEDLLDRAAERALGTPANIRGAEGRSSQTATEASITAESAGTRFDAKIVLFEEMGLKRLAMMMDLNNQQFVSDTRAARVDPEDRQSWQAIAPGDLIGEYDYAPATSSVEAAANKELRREQLTEIMAFLMQAGIPFINYHKLIEEWLKEFDIDSPERFMIPEEQFEMMRRQILEAHSPQEAVPSQGHPSNPENFGATGQLGKNQIPSPHRSGGMAADGQPQPQPAIQRQGV